MPEQSILFFCNKTNHFVCKSVGYWALKDFMDIENEVLNQTLANVLAKLEEHVF